MDSVLSHAALLEIANGRTTRDDLYMGTNWELHTTLCARNDHKIDFANWVAARDPADLLDGLSFLADMLREELNWMGVQFVQPEAVEEAAE